MSFRRPKVALRYVEQKATPGTFARHACYGSGLCVKRTVSMLRTIILIILILLVLGSIPTWPYSTGWGYGPSGGLGLVLVIVIILVLLGYF